jgi:hypothetical protein
MSKKLNYDRYDVRTTLCPDDLHRFNDMRTARGITSTELARQAIIFFLDHAHTPQSEAMEARYIQALKQSTNRICALVSKVAIDTRAVYRYLGELDGNPDHIVECRNKAVVQITRVLTDSERRAADEISKAARPPRAPADESDGNHPPA